MQEKGSDKKYSQCRKEKILPAIDDELAKDLGFENLDALKAGAKEEIEKAKRTDTKIQKRCVLESLTGSYDFDIPESMLERELTAIVHEAKTLKKSDKDEAALRDAIKARCNKKCKGNDSFSIIGEKEG